MLIRYLILGLLSSILASLIAVSFANYYNKTLFDFSMVVNSVSIVAACSFTLLLAGFGAWFTQFLLKRWGEFLFNVLFSFVSMSSIVFVMGYMMPPEVLAKVHEVNGPDSELFFSSFAMPLHFIPVLSWFSLRPLLIKTSN